MAEEGGILKQGVGVMGSSLIGAPGRNSTTDLPLLIIGGRIGEEMKMKGGVLEIRLEEMRSGVSICFNILDHTYIKFHRDLKVNLTN